MSLRVGIGIVTYNRRDLVSGTIDQVRRYTRHADTYLAIADDGSTDGTLEMLRERQIPAVSGVNMGVAWNKNRALFLLSHTLRCDVVVLLEDDTRPTKAGWEQEWIDAGLRFGHINYAAPWMKNEFLSGAGTAKDPIRCRLTTAQCASYSREALTYAGYYDSRFRGFGHEHVEHTARMIRCGYGGAEELIDGEKSVIFKHIYGNLEVIDTPSHANQEEIARNLQVANQLMGDENYRAPWRTRAEMKQFRSEIASAANRSPDAFQLQGPPAAVKRRSWLGRLFRR